MTNTIRPTARAAAAHELVPLVQRHLFPGMQPTDAHRALLGDLIARVAAMLDATLNRGRVEGQAAGLRLASTTARDTLAGLRSAGQRSVEAELLCRAIDAAALEVARQHQRPPVSPQPSSGIVL